MKKISICLFIFIVFAVSLTACSKDGIANNIPLDQQQLTDLELYNDTTADTPKQILKVSYFYPPGTDDFTKWIADAFMKEYPNVEIILDSYPNYEKYQTQTAINIMSGIAGDILDVRLLDYISYSDNGLLADLYQLMEDDSTFDKNDYFTNVFEALEYKGGLYLMPNEFTVRQVAVNSGFSQELVSAFNSLDIVSYKDLMDMYNSLDETDGFYIYDYFNPSIVIKNSFYDFIDFESKTCNFLTSEFISLLENSTALTTPDDKKSRDTVYDYSYPEIDLGHSKKYLFTEIYGTNYQYFMDYDQFIYYENFKPASNDKERLALQVSRKYSILENSPNKELAWSFIKFFASNESLHEYPYARDHAIKKDVYNSITYKNILRCITVMESKGIPLKGDRDIAIAKAIEHYNNLLSRPMVYEELYYHYGEGSFSQIVAEGVHMYEMGVMTAQQVAEDLQNKISLMLLE